MENESREIDARESPSDSAGSHSLQARMNGRTQLGLVLGLPVYVMFRAVAVATQSAVAFVGSDALFLCWTLCLFYTLGRLLGKAQPRSKWLLRLAAAALAILGAVGVARLFGSLDGFPVTLIAGYCAVILLHPFAVEWGLRLNARPAADLAGLHPEGER